MPQVHLKNPDVLMTVISHGNPFQQGEYWNNFLQRIEQRFEAGEVEKLIVVTTGYLQRHYFSLEADFPLERGSIEEKALTLDRQWLEKQSINLKALKIPIKILNWNDLLNQPATLDFPSFEVFSQQIKDDYFNGKDTAFKQLVDEHVDRYITRKIKDYLKGQKNTINRDVFFKVAVDYALEECAILVQLFRCGADCLIYPNITPPPMKHIWKKYFADVQFRYENCKVKKTKAISMVNRHASFLPVSQNNLALEYAQWSLNKLPWASLKLNQQFQFIQNFDRLMHSVSSNNPEEEPSQPHIRIAHRNSV